MGQRFQLYVNYGKHDHPKEPGDNLFAMHLQWCWGPFSIIRAHQLVSFLDGARQNRFNPFGLGPCSQVGGTSFDGRREDLYLLRALSEINLVSSSLVAGHDLMWDMDDLQKWRVMEGKLESLPDSIEISPLAQDNNNGFLVIQATEHEVKYAFCKDDSAIEPVSASEYLSDYRDDLARFDAKEQITVDVMAEDLDGHSLLSKGEIEQIFEKHYDKKLNLENYVEPERPQQHEPLSKVVREAKERTGKTQPSQPKARSPKRNDAPEL